MQCFKNILDNIFKIFYRKDISKDNNRIDKIYEVIEKEQKELILEYRKKDLQDISIKNYEYSRKSEDIPNNDKDDMGNWINNIFSNKYPEYTLDDYSNTNNYYNFNKDLKSIGKNELDFFDRIEIKYFDEIESYEKELEDVISFSSKTFEEIGMEAETKVQEELYKLENNKFRIINNIIIPNYTGKSTQIDSIVIFEFGVIVIETKKINGIVIGDEESKYWSVYSKDFIYKRMNSTKKITTKKIISRKMYNPIRQNKGHILSLKNLNSKFEEINFYSIIAVDDYVELKLNTSTKVIYIKDLITHIYKLVNKESKKFKSIDIDDIYFTILEYKMDYKGIEVEHYKYVNEIKRNKKTTKNKINLEFLLLFSLTPNIGTRTVELVLNMIDNLEYDLNSLDDLVYILGKVHIINSFVNIPSKRVLEYYYEKSISFIKAFNSQGIELIPFYDSKYPLELLENGNYPLIMFSKGNVEILKRKKKVGILVSSYPSKYASNGAIRLGEICAENKIVVVSILGNNYNTSGINGVLDNNGQAILFFSSSLESIVNSEYQEICERVIENGGCILSFTTKYKTYSDYHLSEFNKYFSNIIDKLICIEAHKSLNIQKNMEEIYSQYLQLGYIPQSKKSQNLGNIDYEEQLMSKYNATKLFNSKILNDFLK
ncbi:NERD domain-containing protein [Acetoanaerobium noterae]|uniref:NERD domain-containing protein n=1 Tax=Acetoanaerobium noterae TaxID=745369 RepID=UPI00322181BF